DVVWLRNSGSPTGREPQGDGAPVVVRDRESRSPGEGGQVDRDDRERGRRDAKSRPPESPATGEPDAWKLARPVRRGAVGKGAARSPRWPPPLPHRGARGPFPRTNPGTRGPPNSASGLPGVGVLVGGEAEPVDRVGAEELLAVGVDGQQVELVDPVGL